MIPNPVHVPVSTSLLQEHLAALPTTAGVYSLRIGDNPPHLTSCPNLRKRITRLLDSSYTLGKRLQENLAEVQCWPTGSKLESALVMYRLVKQHFPNDYMKRLRLRPPHFVALTGGSGFPRLAALRDLPRSERNAGIWGPFPSHDAADYYQEQAASLFQLRRCTEVLAPHEDHPGCIYGEMHQCLRPCQAHVSREEYASEAERVREFLLSNGRTLTASLTAARTRASDAMDFEAAAQLHKRMEKVQAAAAARDKVVAELGEFNGVALTRGLASQEFRLWPMSQGCWQEPVVLDCAQQAERPRPLDMEIRERLTECLNTSSGPHHAAEDLAIFARWYFSSWRDGEWFSFRRLSDLNYRKLVRTLSNMAKEVAANTVRVTPGSNT
jgi:hypothetical protein